MKGKAQFEWPLRYLDWYSGNKIATNQVKLWAKHTVSPRTGIMSFQKILSLESLVYILVNCILLWLELLNIAKGFLPFEMLSVLSVLISRMGWTMCIFKLEQCNSGKLQVRCFFEFPPFRSMGKIHSLINEWPYMEISVSPCRFYAHNV